MNPACIILLSILSGSVAGFVGGRISAPSTVQGASDEIRTQKLLLVDEEGRVRGGMAVEDSDTETVSLWMHSTKREGPFARLEISQFKGEPMARLTLKSQDPREKRAGNLILHNRFGIPAVFLNYGGQHVRLGPERFDSTDILHFGGKTGKDAATWPK